MRNSEAKDAQEVLKSLAHALDEGRLQQVIEGPIDAAAEAFIANSTQPGSAAQFHRLIAAFVQALYAPAPTRQLLSKSEAFALSVRLLDRAYGSSAGGGYDLALLEVVRAGQSMDSVLQVLAEAIKEREKNSHVRWVYARLLDPLPWPVKRALVQTIAEVYRDGESDQLFPEDPAALAGHLHDFVEAHLAAVRSIRSLAAIPARTRDPLKC